MISTRHISCSTGLLTCQSAGVSASRSDGVFTNQNTEMPATVVWGLQTGDYWLKPPEIFKVGGVKYKVGIFTLHAGENY